MVYLDEAGIANPAHEPFVVVAGIVLHADQQWKMLERYLSDMADEFVPPENRDGFVFHATELFSGGQTFSREKWPKGKRWKILDHLVTIPEKFKFGVVHGFVERARLSAFYPHLAPKNVSPHAQVLAFTICSYGVEMFMRLIAEDGEVASLIMENNDQSRSLIRQMHQFLRDPAMAHLLKADGFGSLAFTRIVDTVHFAEKGHSSPLQVADACAFVIKRHLMGTPESDRFYEPLKPRMIMVQKKSAPSHDVF
jgi:hypothetical protein